MDESLVLQLSGESSSQAGLCDSKSPRITSREIGLSPSESRLNSTRDSLIAVRVPLAVLNGVVAFVDVRGPHENRSQALAHELSQLGAQIASRFSNDVTHVVFKEGHRRTLNMAKRRPTVKVVSVLWIESCRMSGEKSPEDQYLISPEEVLSTPRHGLVKFKRFRSMQPKEFVDKSPEGSTKANTDRRSNGTPGTSGGGKRIRDKYRVADTPASALFKPRQIRINRAHIFVADTERVSDEEGNSSDEMLTPLSAVRVPDTPPSIRDWLQRKNTPAAAPPTGNNNKKNSCEEAVSPLGGVLSQAARIDDSPPPAAGLISSTQDIVQRILFDAKDMDSCGGVVPDTEQFHDSSLEFEAPPLPPPSPVTITSSSSACDDVALRCTSSDELKDSTVLKRNSEEVFIGGSEKNTSSGSTSESMAVLTRTQLDLLQSLERSVCDGQNVPWAAGVSVKSASKQSVSGRSSPAISNITRKSIILPSKGSRSELKDSARCSVTDGPVDAVVSARKNSARKSQSDPSLSHVEEKQQTAESSNGEKATRKRRASEELCESNKRQRIYESPGQRGRVSFVQLSQISKSRTPSVSGSQASIHAQEQDQSRSPSVSQSARASAQRRKSMITGERAGDQNIESSAGEHEKRKTTGKLAETLLMRSSRRRTSVFSASEMKGSSSSLPGSCNVETYSKSHDAIERTAASSEIQNNGRSVAGLPGTSQASNSSGIYNTPVVGSTTMGHKRRSCVVTNVSSPATLAASVLTNTNVSCSVSVNKSTSQPLQTSLQNTSVVSSRKSIVTSSELNSLDHSNRNTATYDVTSSTHLLNKDTASKDAVTVDKQKSNKRKASSKPTDAIVIDCDGTTDDDADVKDLDESETSPRSVREKFFYNDMPPIKRRRQRLPAAWSRLDSICSSAETSQEIEMSRCDNTAVNSTATSSSAKFDRSNDVKQTLESLKEQKVSERVSKKSRSANGLNEIGKKGGEDESSDVVEISSGTATQPNRLLKRNDKNNSTSDKKNRILHDDNSNDINASNFGRGNKIKKKSSKSSLHDQRQNSNAAECLTGTESSEAKEQNSRRRNSSIEFVKGKKSVTRCRKSWDATMASTSLHRDQQDRLVSAVERLEGFTSVSSDVLDKTTHLVLGDNRRTVKLLQAIVRGLWVVSFDWVTESLRAGEWLSEEPYEQHRFFPAARVSRLKHERDVSIINHLDLFSSLGSIYIDHSCSPPRAVLEPLIISCRGKVTTCMRKASVCVGRSSRQAVANVSELWILDSITSNECLSFDTYRLTE